MTPVDLGLSPGESLGVSELLWKLVSEYMEELLRGLERELDLSLARWFIRSEALDSLLLRELMLFLSRL